MSYFHDWIVDIGTLSCYGKMIKKEMERDNMLGDTYRALDIIWSLGEKMKEHQTLTEHEDQDHVEDSSYLCHKEEE